MSFNTQRELVEAQRRLVQLDQEIARLQSRRVDAVLSVERAIEAAKPEDLEADLITAVARFDASLGFAGFSQPMHTDATSWGLWTDILKIVLKIKQRRRLDREQV